ncbi:hypothetical protein HCG69_05475 [Bacteroides sp. K03]|uniref:hypothetical protein n=1 Tax=Bacteroides sp. K03 TaxID=2718928 RepID=UPI001C8BB3A5|nr:hypothetical protein [Bacteroides sp. K03]MBX9187535.1 hypothetical protein [Bacteroides sp. K03]
MHETGPFSIPAIRDFVPEKLKPWIIIVFVIIFQFSGGVYLAAVSEMVGSTALMQQDIMMAGYASLVGMGLTFNIMFRLKFRFPSKTAFLTCCIVIIICNLICMHTHSVPLLVFVCFIAGIFRMWATFECNSTIQLWLTPKRDLSVFFCFIYLLVQGCMQLSGLLTVYTAFWAKWEYMHWVVIALLLLIMLITMVIFRNFRSMPKLPLYGIDWLGAIMWGSIVLCIIFVCVYGEYYDWYESVYIRAATGAGVVLLLLNLFRASFIRHPFIALATWRYKVVYMTFLFYIIVDVLLAPSHLFEHIYMEAVLGYDSLNVISLNWVLLLGTVAGSVFTFYTFSRNKWCYRTMTVIAFMAITGYLMILYFTIDYNLPKEALIMPLFLRSFGYVIIAICFLTALSRVPFQNFFQAITIQSFVSAGFGGVLGTAILGHALNVVLKKNAMLLGTTLDRVNPLANQLPAGELYGALQQQALMVSMKELYGWLTMISLLCLFLFWISENSVRPLHVVHPRYRVIRRFIKHELRTSGMWR